MLDLLDKWVLDCAVTTTSQAITALRMLRENKNKFDLVISDVHMPDMDGFKLLELVGLEMDLPVISKPKTLHMVFCPLCFSFEDSKGKHAVDFLYGSADFLKAFENDQFHAISSFTTSLTILELCISLIKTHFVS
jgi:hypothetical protein